MSAFIRVSPADVAALGPAHAIVYGWIAWKVHRQPTGWAASYASIATDTGIPQRTVRRACSQLREQGRVESRRASSNDSTLVWMIPEQVATVDTPEVADLDRGGSGFGHLPDVADLATSSYKTVRDNYQDTHAAAGGVEPATDLEPPMREPVDTPALFAVPDQPDVDDGPPKTAKTLVAQWCDGYREATGGADAPKAFMGRVAGQAKNLAKACGDDHEEWVSAYNAAKAAGRQGQADMTRFLVQTRRPSTAPRNVFADPAMGGPGAETMARFSAALSRPQLTPRSLGGQS